MTLEEQEDAYWGTYLALAGNSETRWTDLCEAHSPDGHAYYVCTLPRGHSGRHIGHYGNNVVCARWE